MAMEMKLQPVQGCLSPRRKDTEEPDKQRVLYPGRIRSGSKQLTYTIAALTSTLILAPFFLWIWTAVAICTYLFLRALRWFYPSSSIFCCGEETVILPRPESMKKRVTIKEEDNKYINEESFESKTRDQTSLPFDNVKDPSKRNYEDVSVSITGLRILGAHCNGGANAEYKLHIIAEDGSSWRVWRTYNEIYNIHFIIERVLESDFTRNSFFTRIVPSIPPQKSGYFSMLFGNQRRLMSRRRAGLDEFMQRIFGNKSIEKYRRLTLRIPQVRSFLDLAPLPNQLPVSYRKKQLRSKPQRRGSRCKLVLPKNNSFSLFANASDTDSYDSASV